MLRGNLRMSKKLRFIHAADVHLGSILHVSKKVNKNLSHIFNNAVFNCFERLCDVAIEKQVDFVLISGDIYDREARSVKANGFFIEQCRRLNDHMIKVYAIGGNHDPIKKDSELFTLPPNVHVFSSETVEIVEHRDEQGELLARIIGQSYKENWDSRKMFKKYNAPNNDILNIALLHTQLDGSNNYVPCTVADLKAVENIHYWALGHIHKYSLINKAEPAIVYPGIAQGTDFGEDGIGGAVLVETEDNKIKEISFMPLSQLVWRKIYIQLDKLMEQEQKNISDLENILMTKAEELLSFSEDLNDNFKGYIIKWVVSGRSELYKLLKDKDEELYDYLIETLNSRLLNKNIFLFTDSIEFNLGRPIEDLDILKSENSALKSVTDFSAHSLQQEEIKKQLIRRLGSLWEVTEDLEDINFKKLQLDDEMLLSIIQQAEQLAVDAILQRGEEE
jgi:DNA repair protein SbcD/Mre11